jgi:DNA-binding NarL/FixJ family response regulator
MSARPMRVVIADDESHIRKVIAAIVASLGGEVVAEAADGESAVALVAEHRPDMAILDINMPRLTGDVALERMLAADPCLIGVMMTAQDTMDTVRHCLRLGAREYILKSNPATEIQRLLAMTWNSYEAEVAEGAGA